MILFDLWLPALASVWCFAFQYLPAFMASSWVQRCGSSNKDPFNFAHISIKRKEKREECIETHQSNSASPRTCALSMVGWSGSVSGALTNTRRGDIDILLLLVYLWFSWRLSVAANGLASCVSCKKRLLRTRHPCVINVSSGWCLNKDVAGKQQEVRGTGWAWREASILIKCYTGSHSQALIQVGSLQRSHLGQTRWLHLSLTITHSRAERGDTGP